MGLNEQLEQISRELKEIKGEKEKKHKPFRLPFGKKVSNGQAKKNYVTILKINDNGTITFDKEKISEQTTMIDGVPRLATTNHVLYFKGKPMIVQPSWSVEPFSPKQHFKESLEIGSNKVGYELLLSRMKMVGVEGNKKKMSGLIGWIIGIAILGFIGYALFTGGI